MKKDYPQLILNKYLNEHNVEYIAGVECSIGWYESCKSEAEAVQLLRELVEADGHHVFMRYDSIKPGYYGEKNKLIGRLTWCNTLTGKTETKRITVKNVRVSEMKEWQEFVSYVYRGQSSEWEALHGGEY